MELLEKVIRKNEIIIFCESSDDDGKRLFHLFQEMNLHFRKVKLDRIGEQGIRLQNALIEKTGQKSLPNTFVKGWHVGGFRRTSKCASNGTIQKMLNGTYVGFDYDLMVIGEGPGASMAVLESARLGMKVAFCNYDLPTLENRKSGVTQRFMNLICDPKRLIHRASIIGTNIAAASYFGWETNEKFSFNWTNLITSIQSHTKESNTTCEKYSHGLFIKCLNAIPSFETKHMVELKDKEGNKTRITAKDFIIASSTNAEHFNIPGSNCCITPEDIFYLTYHPGGVIVIGCSEAGLRCVGILAASGIEVTLLATENSMEDYDQGMMDRLFQDLLDLKANVYRNAELQNIEVIYIGKPGEYALTMRMDDGEIILKKFNTMVFANGRLPNVQKWSIDDQQVQCEKGTWKIIVDEQNNTAAKNIFALGSISKANEIQTFASRTALLLVQRLYGARDNVLNICVAPYLLCFSVDYGFVGLSEEQAIKQYGREDIEVYRNEFRPLEYIFSSRYRKCYVKLVCVKSEGDLVVGIHMIGPYAGNVVQGFAPSLRLGAKKSDFQDLVGIHSTTAEQFTHHLHTTD